MAYSWHWKRFFETVITLLMMNELFASTERHVLLVFVLCHPCLMLTASIKAQIASPILILTRPPFHQCRLL